MLIRGNCENRKIVERRIQRSRGLNCEGMAARYRYVRRDRCAAIRIIRSERYFKGVIFESITHGEKKERSYVIGVYGSARHDKFILRGLFLLRGERTKTRISSDCSLPVECASWRLPRTSIAYHY